MSIGRDKLNDFSLLQSLVGEKKISVTNKSQITKDHLTRHHRKVAKTLSSSKQKPIFCMPQFGQKQRRKITVEPPKKSLDETVISINIWKQHLKEERRIFRWLCQRFPKCFCPKNKRPLKIGISKDIEIIYQREHFAPIDPYILRNVLRRYVSDMSYHDSVLKYKMRFNLEGAAVEEYKEEHIAYAKRRLEEITRKSQD